MQRKPVPKRKKKRMAFVVLRTVPVRGHIPPGWVQTNKRNAS